MWTAYTYIIKGDRIAVDWTGFMDPLLGIPGIDQFGLDPMDPVDQGLFVRFLYDAGGGRENHLKAAIPMPNGA